MREKESAAGEKYEEESIIRNREGRRKERKVDLLPSHIRTHAKEEGEKRLRDPFLVFSRIAHREKYNKKSD